MNQRWRSGRAIYRPPANVIQTSEYEVASIHRDRLARAFVEQHHYSSSYPAARFRFGLYRRGFLTGVAVFSHPCNDAVLTKVFRCAPQAAVELGRFVLLDEVPANGETWFLGRCFELLKREELAGVVSFSDPVARRTIEGDIVHRGHIGTIYQAFNGRYLGRSATRTLALLPDGSVLNARAIQKIRSLERGWRYAAALLERFGAAPLSGDPAAWLACWLPKLTRTLRHSGNHKYAWPLHRSAYKEMPGSLPYPKFSPLFFTAPLSIGSH
jgi:hypothetical protein